MQQRNLSISGAGEMGQGGEEVFGGMVLTMQIENGRKSEKGGPGPIDLQRQEQ